VEKIKVGVLLVLIVCMAVMFEQMSEFRGLEEVTTAGGRGASIVGSAALSRHTSWASLGKYLALVSLSSGFPLKDTGNRLVQLRTAHKR